MWHWGLRAYIWYFSVSKTIYFVFYHLLIQFPDGFVPRHAFWLRLSSEIAHFGSRLVSDGAILMLRWPATTPKFMKKNSKNLQKIEKIFFHIISYDDVGTFEKRQSVSFRSETHSKLAPKIPMWSQDGQAPPQIDEIIWKNIFSIIWRFFEFFSWILVYIFWLTMRFSASRHYWQSDELSPSSDGVRRRAAA